MTPPVGRTLLIGYSIGNVSVEKVIKPLLRFFEMPVLTVLLIAYVQKKSLCSFQACCGEPNNNLSAATLVNPGIQP
nr:hypothetical protein [uncultured Cohaesibacter sp.]